jgi:hypothetical protein
VTYGFIQVANEATARPIRNLTTMKGYDATKLSLSCFGGAGPLHCCAIAKSLGMKKIFVYKYSAFYLPLLLLTVTIFSLNDGKSNGNSCSNSNSINLIVANEKLDILENEAKS